MIESRTTRRFWRMFEDLPHDAQQEAKRAYRLFRTDPGYPSLHFKKLEGDIYSARIGLGYRAMAVLRGQRAVWFWIGTHAEYDRLT